ncbi:MAG: hypothetical protein GY725_10475 [bacterium]|nr:hypothetical protein [bacterium]
MATRDVQGELGLSLGDLVQVFRRRIWWFLVPVGIAMVFSAVLAMVLPAEYEAEATVAVEPQVIPPELAHTTITAPTEARYENLRLQVLARDNLNEVIDEFKLFEGETAPREDLIDDLRARITVAPLPPAIYDPRKLVELNSFRIAFSWDKPKIAAEVTNRLTRDFISANLRDRASMAEGTTEFFEQELGKARTELADVGRQITDYKENFQGELPEQLLLNRERLERTRMDLAAHEAKLETARNQTRLLEQQIQEMNAAAAGGPSDPEDRKKALELTLTSIISQGKTDKHPDVRLVRAEIAALEAMIVDQAEAPAPTSISMVKLKNEARDYEVSQRVYAGEVERLKAEIADLEQRIENTPRRQAELDHLTKGYETLHTAIRAIQLKKVDADMGRTIELANKGERFKIVESAVPPTSPFKPNRPLWFIAGTLLGVIAGLALLVIRELSDQTFHSVADVQKALGMPVLAAVPSVEFPKDHSRRRVWAWSASSAAILAALLIGGTILYFATRADAKKVTQVTPKAATVAVMVAHV